ncbi:selenocysteine insertion sequence-binding protein 2-like [Hippoglossus hippoglossus]|uniref:selenocysteine insertion sequence-binding protein 2-like n=1 Tax=Hippoglossus hippoglossus TaxID=8267 RepID=UPI00148D4BDB|nr:selenocysteine insertion sequence-binding protein 2-like [Hippoglossus hippoglossus]
MDKPFDPKPPRRLIKEPAESHTALSPHLILPNPYVSGHISKGNQSGLSPKAARRGDVPRNHGYNNSRRVGDTSDDLLWRDRSTRDPQAKASRSNNGSSAQSRVMDKSTTDAQRRGFRGTRSATNSAGTSKPAQTNLVPFEVKMADFPELAGFPPSKAAPSLLQKECWGPIPPPMSPQTQPPASTWKSGRRRSPTRPDPQQRGINVKPDPPAIPADQPAAASWANVASQPPKKIVLKEEKTITSNRKQTEENAASQEEGTAGKKRRKKKKKRAKGADEDEDLEFEEPAIYQEPPKFEDEEEFPGLTPALTRTDRFLSSSNAAKLCNEENQRIGGQHLAADQNKEKSNAAKTQSTETTKKGQVSGKKSKVPVQLDIGNMLAALEKKQQSQKAKQDAKPVILSVGGGLPVAQKQGSVQKKPPWQQGQVAHNPLDSTCPMVKKGKQREVPKAKKPTPLKKVILKEREERKHKRLLEERGLVSEDELKPVNDADEEQCDITITDEVGSPTEDLDDQSEFSGTNLMVSECEEDEKEETVEQQTTSPVPCAVSRPKIHSRKFRDYCSQMLSKDVDECVTTLLKELVRFQDRLYQKDPMKARMKRRIVMGLREVLKHLKLRKVKCVVISPNCERIQAKGGLDEALHNIIDTCREQGVPFVFALSRKALGRCVNKAVPVSLVGIFNYDGAQDHYHKMIELSSEARRAYEVMVSSLEQSDQAEAEQAANSEEELQISSMAEEAEPSPESTHPEDPEYLTIWKKMLQKEYNHTFLNFEEQLSSLCLDSECTENTDEDVKS